MTPCYVKCERIQTPRYKQRVKSWWPASQGNKLGKWEDFDQRV